MVCNTTSELKTLKKQPGETRAFGMDFSNKMVKTESIQSVDNVTSTPAGLTFGANSISGQVATTLISGGTHGKTYIVTVTVTTDIGQVLENEGILEVNEVG